MKLRAREVSYAYHDQDVIHAVSLEVAPREILGIVGPNGAGKSTLLRCLHGSLRPSRGEVWIDDVPVARMRPKEIARRVAVVPQSSSPGFPFTIAEFVALGRYAAPDENPRASTLEHAAVRSALTRVGLLHLADRTIDRVSGGEFRKVLFAQALAQSTQILLLDEPLQNLDLRHQLEVMQLVSELSTRSDAAVITVLHDLTMAARFCDRLLLLHRGRAVAVGVPEVVLTSEHLKLAYEVDAHVRRCELTGKLEVIARAVAGSQSQSATS